MLRFLPFVFCLYLGLGSASLQAQLSEAYFRSIDGEFDSFYPTDRVELAARGVRLVTDTYGPLVVAEGRTDYSTPEHRHPWSSWFFPLAREELFEGNSSPLAKFDRAVGQFGFARTFAQEIHERNIHDPRAEPSDGFCAALAYASVMDTRLKRILTPVSVRGVCFTPRDLKALSLLTYEAVEASKWNGRFGQRFDIAGPRARGALARDIYPAEFHRFVQVQLGDRKVPFIMDADASHAVWKYAVFRASVEVRRKAGDPNAAQVAMNVEYAKAQLTREEQLRDTTNNIGLLPINRTYYYELYGEWRGSNFHVRTQGVASRWAGQERLYHPDFVEEFPGAGDLEGRGKQIIEAERGSRRNTDLRKEFVDLIIQEAVAAQPCRP